MNIIASASVPPEQRLNDAPTADIPAITRPRPADDRFPVLNSGAHRGDERTAQPAGDVSAMDDRYAQGYADAVGHAVASRPSAATMELGRKVELLIESTDMKPAEIAEWLGVTVAEAIDAHIERICWQEGAHRLVGVQPAEGTAAGNPGCPPHCSRDHRGEVTESDGFSIGVVHERIVAEVPALDPATVTAPATATVLVESTTERGEVVTPTRVTLSVAEGAEGGYPGSEGVQGWTGTPEQAEMLGLALIEAARTVKADR